MRKLVEKYRTIFTWDIPDIDEQAANTLILAALRTALENIEAQSSGE